MKWIKYKYICGIDNDVEVFATKKIGYSDANLVIAEAEAYNGEYAIEEDDKNYPDVARISNNIDMNGFRITNLGDPEDSFDAVNLAYAQKLIKTGGSGEGLDRNMIFELMLQKQMAQGLLYEIIESSNPFGYRLKSLSLGTYSENGDGVLFIPGVYNYSPVFEIGPKNEEYETSAGLIYDQTLTAVYLSENIKIVNPYAFSCNNISIIVLPSTITELKQGCFSQNPIEHVYYNGTIAQWSNVVLDPNWTTETGDSGSVDYTIHCIDGDISITS